MALYMGNWRYFTLLVGVATPCITGWGPPCIYGHTVDGRFWNWYKNSISGIISGAGFFPPTVWTAMLVHGYWGPLWMLHSTLLNPNRHSTEEGCIFNQDSGWLKHSPCGHGGDPRSPTGLSYFGNVLLHWLQQNSNTPDQWRRDCCQASCWVPSPTPDLDEFQDQKIKAIRQSIVKISFNPGTT